MSDDILIHCDHVSKKFCKDLKRSLWYGLKDVGLSLKGNVEHHNRLRKDEFWAVKDVSFELRRGECLGLIGHNGAGKSTLLKMLNGLINPDQGSITMKGRVGALIELGAGFNPILTGRENIYNNGAVLGFTKEEIDRKFESIIDFAEIGEFIDSPVQNYSSGMKVRLGFAVAAHMDPDILLIDEVLAVGDTGFIYKSLTRISELLKKCAVIFVSHSMPLVGKICTSAIKLKRGQITDYSSNVSDVILSYFSEFSLENESVFGNGKARISNYRLTTAAVNENGIPVASAREQMRLNFDLAVDEDIDSYLINVVIVNMEFRFIAMTSTLSEEIFVKNERKSKHVSVNFENLLTIGKYNIIIDVIETVGPGKDKNGQNLISLRNVCEFVSEGTRFTTYCPVHLKGEWHFNQKILNDL